MNAYSPKGRPIVGTHDRLVATALIQDGSFKSTGKGTVDFEWAGDTDVHWESQVTAKRRGERLFEDDWGGLWRESQLKLESE